MQFVERTSGLCGEKATEGNHYFRENHRTNHRNSEVEEGFEGVGVSYQISWQGRTYRLSLYDVFDFWDDTKWARCPEHSF